MDQEKLNLLPFDWEKLSWQGAPYPGVFVSILEEEPDPSNSKVPFFTVMAIRVDPGCSIPLHHHEREPYWKEILNFQEGGKLEIYSIGGSKIISDAAFLTFTIGANEAFGLRNNNSSPLYFFSRMEPGFTGYDEIEEIK